MKPFRFGVQSYFATSPAAFRESARTAEALGYSSFHLADHYIGPGPALTKGNHPVQNVAAVPAMAVIGEATSTIRIGCRVFCTDYRNAVVFAKELATLDYFNGGRLEIGLGAGWLQPEYEAMGMRWERAGVRIDRMVETINVVRGCFSGGELNIEGEHVRAVGFEPLPRRDDNSCPPIMVGGGSRRVLTLAGQLADIVSLNFNNSAGKIGPEGVASGRPEVTAEKIGWIRASGRDPEIEIGAYFTNVVAPGAGAATREKMGTMFGMTAEQLAVYPHALVGDVDEICAEIVRRREEYGISYISVGGSVMEAFAPVVARLAGS